MPKGLIPSIVLHSAIFLIIVFGLPSISDKKIFDDQVVTVEILPISEITNVKTRKVKPKTKPEKKKEVTSATPPKIAQPDPNINDEPEITTEPAPEPIVKKTKKDQTITENKVNPIVAPKLKPKKKTKKPEKKETLEDLFGAVMKSVEELDAPEDQEPEEEPLDFTDVENAVAGVDNKNKFRPGLPLSIGEKDAIRAQIMQNWTVLAGAKNADMTVTINISVLPDGTINKISFEDQTRYNTDSFFKAMVDSAIRAVRKSSPLKNLPPEKYDVKDGWREMEINFDPSEMMY